MLEQPVITKDMKEIIEFYYNQEYDEKAEDTTL